MIFHYEDEGQKWSVLLYNVLANLRSSMKECLLLSLCDCNEPHSVEGGLTLYHIILNFNDPEKEAFQNIVRKGENAGNQHFLLLPQCFLPIPKRTSVVKLHLFCLLQVL